jgi:hypothetical protein|nr:MAG TPA: Regulator of chromosome condensation (RCC1) repeat [Caudoviricetes sp.]
MLNIEYYKDKLVELCVIDIDRLALIQGQPRICNSSLLCDECLLNNKNEFCSNEALNWLFSEYEEPEVDWSKVEVDTPILVTDDVRSKWFKRYFAKFVDGKVYAWGDGATSWTADGECDVTSWNCAKLAESED